MLRPLAVCCLFTSLITSSAKLLVSSAESFDLLLSEAAPLALTVITFEFLQPFLTQTSFALFFAGTDIIPPCTRSPLDFDGVVPSYVMYADAPSGMEIT